MCGKGECVNNGNLREVSVEEVGSGGTVRKEVEKSDGEAHGQKNKTLGG